MYVTKVYMLIIHIKSDHTQDPYKIFTEKYVPQLQKTLKYSATYTLFYKTDIDGLALDWLLNYHNTPEITVYLDKTLQNDETEEWKLMSLGCRVVHFPEKTTEYPSDMIINYPKSEHFVIQ